jgi:hypothetical protein
MFGGPPRHLGIGRLARIPSGVRTIPQRIPGADDDESVEPGVAVDRAARPAPRRRYLDPVGDLAPLEPA